MDICQRHSQGYITGKTYIDTRPLLKKHRHRRHNHPLKHGLCLKQRFDSHKLQLERVPRRLRPQLGEMFSHSPLLEKTLRFDLEELELDEFMVGGQAPEIGKHLARLGLAAVVDEPAGGEGHEEHPKEENERGRDLQTNGGQPRCVALRGEGRPADEVRPVVDPETDHDAKGDGELLEGDQTAADLGWGNFAVVDGHNHGEAAHAHTRDETACEDRVVPGGGDGCGLDDDAQEEDGDGDEDTVFARDGFGKKA